MNYITAIGLEVHVELKTNSKLFCGCRNEFSRQPNTNVCPVCLGYPGVLPVVNKKAVDLLIKSALSLNCDIAAYSKFDRKNYFYPDMPKNYQISQYDMPLAENGFVEVKAERRLPSTSPSINSGLRLACSGQESSAATTDEYEKIKIRIKRIHLEEDTGKSVHQGTIDKSEYTLEDYNRAGVPLMEIVTEPDITSSEEAYEFLTKLKKILHWIGVSDCKMEEGSLRCDANISVRQNNVGAPDPSTSLRTSCSPLPDYKVEIKNLNSFKSVLKALAYEQNRQTELLKNNEKIEQCTRGWDEDKQVTILMRSKEDVHDYRYFPEPDLLPMEVSSEWINKIKTEIPELPEEKTARFMRQYNLTSYDSEVLTQTKEFSEFFEDVVKKHPNSKIVCNWLTQDISKRLNDTNIEIENSKLTVDNFVKMLELMDNGVISGKIAKTIIEDLINGENPETIVKEKGLTVISDSSELEKIVEKVLADNADSVEKYKSGNEKVFGFIVGQIMKETKGKAAPKQVNELLIKKLRG